MSLRIQRSGLIASRQGSVPYEGYLLAWANGAFVRPTEGSYLTDADSMAWALANQRREDSGLFGETLTLIEKQSANLVTFSEDYSQASWGKVSATLAGAPTPVAAPDGEIDAFTVDFTASANARLNLTMASSLMPNGTIITASRWHKLVSGGGLHRLDIVQRDGVTSAPTLADVTAPVNWAREIRRSLNVGTGAGNVQFRHRNGSTGLATGVSVWGSQVELGRYETSYIRVPGASAVTRQADQATWLAAEVPLLLRTSAARMRTATWWNDADLVASDERWLLSFGGASNGIRVRNDAGSVKLEAVAGGAVTASLVLSGLSRRSPVYVSWDPSAGTVSWDGTTGAVGTPWTWPGVSVRVGGILGGASEWDGGVDLPETV